jgi:hypothetical protein
LLETSAPLASFSLAPTFAGIWNGNQSNQGAAIQQVETNQAQGPEEQLPNLIGANCDLVPTSPLPTCGNLNAIDLITDASPDFIFQTYLQQYLPVTSLNNPVMDFKDSSGISTFTISGPGQVLTISLVPLLIKIPAMVAGEKTFSVMSERVDPANHVISAVTLKGHPLAGWRYWRVYSVGAHEVIIETGAYDQPGPGPLNYIGYYLSQGTVSLGKL